MTLEALRSLARLHAVTAWIATLALLAGAALHLRRHRAAAAASVVAAALALATSALGLAIHDGYRARLRQKLFIASATLGWLFERKLHLAFGATLIAVSAAAVTILLRRAAARSHAAAHELRRAAALGLLASAILALAASVASAIVARRAVF